MTEAPLPHPSVFLGQQRLKVIRGYRVHEQRTPSQDIHVITPSQTIGPFFGVGLVRPGDEDQMIARTRRRLLLAARAYRDSGELPPGASDPDTFMGARAGSFLFAPDAPLEQAYQAQLEKAVRWTAQPEERA